MPDASARVRVDLGGTTIRVDGSAFVNRAGVSAARFNTDEFLLAVTQACAAVGVMSEHHPALYKALSDARSRIAGAPGEREIGE